MTETEHRILLYQPMIAETEMSYEDGQLHHRKTHETIPAPELENEETKYFQCECGKEFETSEAAEEHLRKVRDGGDN